MSRARLLLAAALLVLAAYVGVRALLRPDPYATLAREAGGTWPTVGPAAPPAPTSAPAPSAAAPPAPPPASAPSRLAAAGPPDTPSRRDPPTAAALRAALAALDRARAAGYADPVAADPDDWAARSCACHAEDVRRLRRLAGAGLSLRGHRAAVLRVRLLRAGPATADLLVTDRVGSYRAVTPRGRVAARWPAAAPQRWRIRLVRAGARWLLGAVARAP